MVAHLSYAKIPELKKHKKVYFFGTCVVDAVSPRAGLSAMMLLRNSGIEPMLPAGQTCCGQPAYNSGFRDQALKVARAQLELFPEPLPIIVPSASCAEMIVEHYQTLFSGTEWEESAAEFSRRVYEWTWFFKHVVNPDLKDCGPPVKVYCHISCHGRGIVPDLISCLENVELLEIPHASECCGFGGAFSIKHDGISGRMAGNKADEIIASGASTLVSSEASCLMNIEGVLKKRGSSIKCMHLADFLYQRTNSSAMRERA